MNNCYKVVVNNNGALESITPPAKGGLTYIAGEIVTPEIGPVFVFRELDAAVNFWHTRRADYEGELFWHKYGAGYRPPVSEFSDEIWEAEGYQEISMRFMIWPGYKLNSDMIEWFWKTNAHQYLPMNTEKRNWIYQSNPLDQTVGFESIKLTRKLEDWEVYERLRGLNLLNKKSGKVRQLYDWDARKRK